MKGFLAAAALVGAAVATPFPQTSAPSGCSSSRSGGFTINVVNVTSSAKRDVEARQLAGVLTLTLADGVLKDQAGRTGYIAANRQFQFDNPIQAGAVITSGWSVCSNNSLALSGSAIFYQCLSGNFYNLYDQSQGNQCSKIYIVAAGASSSAAASQLPDGQPQATTQAVSQITDGQVQASTGRPVSQITDGQIQASTGRPVSQISDGQVQGATATGRPVSQISDGQIQASTAKPSSATGRPVSQISDGQIQASTGRPVSQITDGQIQAPTSTRPAVATFTGAAARELAGSFAFVAGIVGAVAML